jgi:Fe-S-cluster containining protein
VADPTEVQRLAEELQGENWTFRAWIKSGFDLDDEQLMSIVQWLAKEVTDQIDCTTCANCCQVLAPLLDQGDMQRLARALDLDVLTLQATYLRQDESGEWELPAPCPLLDGKLCRVYHARPKPCREYPHLHNDFRAHSIARIEDTYICPIVFNVVEGMKVELDWYASDELDLFDW